VDNIDFTFAWESASASAGPWGHLRVVAFHGTEAISSLYRYEITVLVHEPAPELDPYELINARATLRIDTLTEPPCRVIHGIIVEAEELGAVPRGMLYRIVLAPPLARAMHRARCRIFLEKTTRQIIDAVLLGDPELQRDDGAVAPPDGGDDLTFTTARELFAWRVTDSSRIDDAATRPYCVQYNESDFAFVSRLLEEEGISYHFENGYGVCLLVLSDKDGGRTRAEPFARFGPGIPGRAISSMKLGARLRPRKVSLVDYNWKQPALDMAVATPAPPSAMDLVDHEYPGRYTETPAMGQPLAAAKLERLEVEASYAVGEGTCRSLAAGSIFAVEHPQSRYEGEYLVAKLEVRGEQQGALPPNVISPVPVTGVPYVATLECVRRGKNGSAAESRFRPARLTRKPRVQGSQTGFVTAEPATQGAEIHVGGPPGGEIGCVRVKFHWDQETQRHAKEPTSCWVRVSQMFAGVGEGGVFHPRVGVEVIVDFEEGDPDRPIVVGRVYNGKNRPPGGAPTVSTFKTMSSPATGAFNELTFDDTAGNEQIKMHTPFNWNSDAGNDRSEKVGMNSASSAGVDRNESTGSNRSTMTGANNSEMIGGNESVTVGANQNVTIGANQTETIGANQTVTITGNQTESITGNRKTDVTSNDELTVTGTQKVNVTGAQTTTYLSTHDVTVTSTQKIDVTGEQTIHAVAAQGLKSDTSQKIEAPEQEIKADGKQTLKSSNFLADASSEAKITSPTILVDGSAVEVKGSTVTIKGGTITIQDGNISIQGGAVSIKGSPITMDGGGEISATAGLIKLN
jgi:type VI secretion system secreted protein VgrG